MKTAIATIEQLKMSAYLARSIAQEITGNDKLSKALRSIAHARADSLLRRAEITRQVNGLLPDPELPFVAQNPAEFISGKAQGRAA